MSPSDSPAEQERRLRTAISDAIQDSLGLMVLEEETLDDMVESVMLAIKNLVGG